MRRSLVAALLAAALVSATTQGASAGPGTTAWGSPSYNAARSNFNSYESRITSSTVKRLRYQQGVALAPIADCDGGGTNFVVSGDTLYTTEGNHLSAVNLVSGKRLWQGPPAVDRHSRFTTLSVSDGRLFLVTYDCESASDPGAVLTAFSATTGARSWSVGTSGFGGMAVVGNRVVLSGDPGTGGRVRVYDSATGAVAWVPDGYCGGALVVGGNLIVTCFSSYDDDAVYTTRALALADGRVVWSRPGTYEPQRGDKPSAEGADVYVRLSTGFIADMAPATGKIKWKSGTEKGPVLAVAATSLLVSCDGGMLCALDRATGSRLWKVPSKVSAAIVAGDVVYTAGAGARRLSTGARLAISAGYPSAYPRMVANGRLFMTSTDRVIDVYGVPSK